MKFKDNQLQNTFATDGYCKLQLLNNELVSELRQFAEETILNEPVANTDYGMYVSLEEQQEKKQRITRFVRDKVAPHLDTHLIDYKIHLGGYLIKAPDHKKYTFPHQDWTFVDHETDDVSATIWISLYDLEEHNGTLGFLKGSHRYLDHIVGSPSPVVPTPSMGKELFIFSHLQFESVAAGEALIFNNKTIHAAMPNSGDFYRVAVGLGITPRSTGLYHYFLNPDNSREFLKLEVEEEFFMRYNNDDLMRLFQEKSIPEFCKVVGKTSVNAHLYPDVDHIQKCMNPYNNPNNGYIMDLKNHFGQNESYEEAKEKEDEPVHEWRDERSFFQIYTPLNIYREARYRVSNWLSK